MSEETLPETLEEEALKEASEECDEPSGDIKVWRTSGGMWGERE